MKRCRKLCGDFLTSFCLLFWELFICQLSSGSCEFLKNKRTIHMLNVRFSGEMYLKPRLSKKLLQNQWVTDQGGRAVSQRGSYVAHHEGLKSAANTDLWPEFYVSLMFLCQICPHVTEQIQDEDRPGPTWFKHTENDRNKVCCAKCWVTVLVAVKQDCFLLFSQSLTSSLTLNYIRLENLGSNLWTEPTRGSGLFSRDQAA